MLSFRMALVHMNLIVNNITVEMIKMSPVAALTIFMNMWAKSEQRCAGSFLFNISQGNVLHLYADEPEPKTKLINFSLTTNVKTTVYTDDEGNILTTPIEGGYLIIKVETHLPTPETIGYLKVPYVDNLVGVDFHIDKTKSVRQVQVTTRVFIENEDTFALYPRSWQIRNVSADIWGESGIQVQEV
jgi:hypothetical protein